jgi:asparagine synthase (glutamine-hydrolysing)
MSGIFGLFNLDDAPVARAELQAMTAMLERRGPEGTDCWRDGSVGLGHTLLATTPEHLFGNLPFRHAETGCVITADARLDNRGELFRSLDLEEQDRCICDGELILLAYLKWGENSLDRLLGDFAFAIWDSRDLKFFCARDQFGMRPFDYHFSTDRCFVFASDPRAILVLPQVPYRINEGRIADFLVPELERIDFTSTFYEDIYRLHQSHSRPAPRPARDSLLDAEWRHRLRIRYSPRGRNTRLEGRATIANVLRCKEKCCRLRRDTSDSSGHDHACNCAESGRLGDRVGHRMAADYGI